ncbi:acyl-CoA thioesterase [Oceanobacillus sp. CF4.6]|uniref:acyl-CoA thioesterase n=1 Tax=Oceanobacillus sp. CF4.6 TaxID=3373080 RepID=UPI003EE7C716
MKTKFTRNIRESDIDILGHVTYTTYIELMTEARTDWVAQLIAPMEVMTNEIGIAYPVVHISRNNATASLKSTL